MLQVNLYLISQDENNDYDTYDSAIVCARSEKVAREIHPNTSVTEKWYGDGTPNYSWASHPSNVKVELIGIAMKGIKKGVVLASFNAG
jgi:hypothetical protein